MLKTKIKNEKFEIKKFIKIISLNFYKVKTKINFQLQNQSNKNLSFEIKI